MPLPRGLSMSGRAAVSSEGLTEGGSTPKLTHMVVSRIQFLRGCWNEGLSSLWSVGRSSLIYGPLSRVAHNMASDFHQSNQARKSEQAGKPNFESNILSHLLHLFVRSESLNQLVLKAREFHKDVNTRRWESMGIMLEADSHNIPLGKFYIIYIVTWNSF